jgi:hypothetical protein
MSFRDFVPRNGQGGVDAPDGGAEYSTPPQQLKKNTLRRAMSGGSNINHMFMSSSNNGGGGGTPNHSFGSTTHRPIPQCRQQHFDTIEFCRSRSESDYNTMVIQQSLMIQQREEEYAIHIMQQREENIRDIHQKIHVVNEIYKELGEVVTQQGEQIDVIEKQFQYAAENTQRGLEQIETANGKKKKQKDAGERNNNDDDERNDNDTKAKKFFVHRVISRTIKEITKALSICGGSGSLNFVDDSCCKP